MATRIGGPARLTRWIGVAAIGTIAALATGGPAVAHEGIADSVPSSGSTLESPISEVVIDFGTPIGDDTEIAVIDPDGDALRAVTTLVSDSEARAEFTEIDQKGSYIARYVTTSIEDGHLLVGAISFDYGSTDGGWLDGATVLVIGASILILATGAYLSYRKYRSQGADGSQVDDDLSDVGV